MKLQNATILLVDDQLDVRQSLLKILQRAGGATVIACDGITEALEQLASTRIDAIVSDFALGRGTALDLALAVHQEQSSVPIFVITGDPQRVMEACQARSVAWNTIFAGVFSKPIPIQVFINAIASGIPPTPVNTTG